MTLQFIYDVKDEGVLLVVHLWQLYYIWDTWKNWILLIYSLHAHISKQETDKDVKA